MKKTDFKEYNKFSQLHKDMQSFYKGIMIILGLIILSFIIMIII